MYCNISNRTTNTFTYGNENMPCDILVDRLLAMPINYGVRSLCVAQWFWFIHVIRRKHTKLHNLTSIWGSPAFTDDRFAVLKCPKLALKNPKWKTAFTDICFFTRPDISQISFSGMLLSVWADTQYSFWTISGCQDQSEAYTYRQRLWLRTIL